HNLQDQGAWCGSGIATTADARLSLLGLFDKPSPIVALQPGSPAINAGDPAVCAAYPVSNQDQRGFGRDSACDVGAYGYDATPTPRGITVTTTGTGSGTVTMSPDGGISCGNDGQNCWASLPYGAIVVLMATPDPGSSFAGWTGGCT